MTTHTYAIHTMGCKLNIYDSEVIAQALEDAGFVRLEDVEAASLVVINTCTVTGKSDAEARHLMRRIKRRNPSCFLAVTGCYAQSQMAQIQAMPEADFVSSNVGKYRLDPLIEAYHSGHAELRSAGAIHQQTQADFELLARIRAKTRGFVKIQDGCHFRCAFCIVPYVRGPSRSVPADKILNQLDVLDRAGLAEVVLTGIHIGSWGQDFRPKRQFVDLLDEIDQADFNLWIRLSSLEPTEISDHLIALLQSSKTIVPHLHLPLQSGCDATLSRMNRRHTTARFRARAQTLKETVPDICIGADVIVGFPGETPEEFRQTRQFLEESPLDYLHVFPFSRREGTAAAEMPDPVDPQTVRQRAAELRALSDAMRRRHVARHLHTQRPAIVLPKPLAGRPRSALTDNYIEVAVHAPAESVGTRCIVAMTDVVEGDAVGHLTDADPSGESCQEAVRD